MKSLTYTVVYGPDVFTNFGECKILAGKNELVAVYIGGGRPHRGLFSSVGLI